MTLSISHHLAQVRYHVFFFLISSSFFVDRLDLSEEKKTGPEKRRKDKKGGLSGCCRAAKTKPHLSSSHFSLVALYTTPRVTGPLFYPPVLPIFFLSFCLFFLILVALKTEKYFFFFRKKIQK